MGRIRGAVGAMSIPGGGEGEEGGMRIAIVRMMITMTGMIGEAARGIGMEGALGGVGGMITDDDDDVLVVHG